MQPGDTVYHETWGYGRIVRLSPNPMDDGKIIIVEFFKFKRDRKRIAIASLKVVQHARIR
jgi:transcription elongation factor GreA-like protein